MTVRDYYEHYWSREQPYSDPLSADRRRLLWYLTEEYLPKQAKVLEIGCGEGDTVGDALARGHQASGADVAEAAIARARKRFPEAEFRRFSADELPWPVTASGYDLVVAFEVLEHLVWPRTLFAGAHAALAPGGTLVVSTPFHGLLKNLALAMFAFERHFSPDGEHVRFATDRWLLQALRDAGFEPYAVQHLGRRFGLWSNTMIAARKQDLEPQA